MRLLYGGGRGGVIGWWYEISCVLCREGVYMGVYYANLSIVQFRAMILLCVFFVNEDGHKRRNM